MPFNSGNGWSKCVGRRGEQYLAGALLGRGLGTMGIWVGLAFGVCMVMVPMLVRAWNVGELTGQRLGGRGLHSSAFQLNLSRFGHTFPCPPVQWTGWKSCTHRISQNMLTLSRKADECKPPLRGSEEDAASGDAASEDAASGDVASGVAASRDAASGDVAATEDLAAGASIDPGGR